MHFLGLDVQGIDRGEPKPDLLELLVVHQYQTILNLLELLIKTVLLPETELAVILYDQLLLLELGTKGVPIDQVVHLRDAVCLMVTHYID